LVCELSNFPSWGTPPAITTITPTPAHPSTPHPIPILDGTMVRLSVMEACLDQGTFLYPAPPRPALGDTILFFYVPPSSSILSTPPPTFSFSFRYLLGYCGFAVPWGGDARIIHYRLFHHLSHHSLYLVDPLPFNMMPLSHFFELFGHCDGV